MIAANAVTSGKILDGAVTSADIRDTTVTTADVKDDAITSVKILDGAVTSTDNRDTTVNTAELKDGAVTSVKILDAGVTTADIADTNVTMAKIARAGAATGQVVKWTGSAWAPGQDNTGGGSQGGEDPVGQRVGPFGADGSEGLGEGAAGRPTLGQPSGEAGEVVACPGGRGGGGLGQSLPG